MPTGQKHLISCRCILPSFLKRPEPIFHKFIVFSIIDDNNQVIPKFANCNNCGITHKVFDICKSAIINDKENLLSISTIQDIKQTLPDKIAAVLESNNADLPTYENVQFVIQNEKWNDFVVIASEKIDNTEIKKVLQFKDKDTFTIQTVTIQ